MELGIGVGLFARYFLDRLRELCRQHKKDVYDRLTYIAADRSERMLNDVLRHGVLADHAGHYCVRRIDAMQPEKLAQDAMLRHLRSKPLRAVFLNYLLDCLPAAVLEWDGERVRQLCVRTCVARNVRLADYTDLTAEQLRQRATSTDSQARDELLEVYGLFASEYDYQPVDPQKLPHGPFAVEYGRKRTNRLLHSYGAIQCLDKLLGMLADGGFILVNDYGQTTLGRDDEFEHQRFSLATFVGVNFALLKAYYEQTKRCQYLEPAGEEGRGIHARLLAPKIDYEVHHRHRLAERHPLRRRRLGSGSGQCDRQLELQRLGRPERQQRPGHALPPRRPARSAVARQDAGVQYWYLTDYQGSVRDVLDNSGNVKDAITYDGFGNIISETNSAYRGSYAWTGRLLDVETGLQYNRARWYDPATGRWQSQDPMGFDAGDSNLYRYVNNAPTNATDPSGFFGVEQQNESKKDEKKAPIGMGDIIVASQNGAGGSLFNKTPTKPIGKLGSAAYKMKTTKGTEIEILFTLFGDNCHSYSVGGGVKDSKVPADLRKFLDDTVKAAKASGGLTLNPDEMAKVLKDGYEKAGTDLSKAQVGDLVVFVGPPPKNELVHSCRITKIEKKDK